jgi:hypothetical protein
LRRFGTPRPPGPAHPNAHLLQAAAGLLPDPHVVKGAREAVLKGAVGGLHVARPGPFWYGGWVGWWVGAWVGAWRGW